MYKRIGITGILVRGIAVGILLLLVLYVLTTEQRPWWFTYFSVIALFIAGAAFASAGFKPKEPRYPLFWAVMSEAGFDLDEIRSIAGLLNSGLFRGMSRARRLRALQRQMPKLATVADIMGVNLLKEAPPRMYGGWEDDRQEVAIFLQCLRDRDEALNPMKLPDDEVRKLPAWQNRLIVYARISTKSHGGLIENVQVHVSVAFGSVHDFLDVLRKEVATASKTVGKTVDEQINIGPRWHCGWLVIEQAAKALSEGIPLAQLFGDLQTEESRHLGLPTGESSCPECWRDIHQFARDHGLTLPPGLPFAEEKPEDT